MAVDRELGAGSWSYFGDPRAISHAGDTFTGWISTTGNVWVARYTAERQAHQARDLQGPRARRPQQPVARLPPRRAHHGLLLAALRAPPAAARASPSAMRYMVSLNPYSIDGFGKVHTVDTNVPGGLGYTYPNPMQLQDKLWLFWRGGAWNPTFSYTDGRHPLGAGPRARLLRPRPAAVHEVRHRRQARRSTASSPTATRRTGRTASTTRATRTRRSTPWSGRKLGTLKDVPLHTSKLDHIYNYSDARRARLGPRHRADRRRPAARRLHAPGQQPRHLLVRLPQRHEVDQPQDRRGRGRPPVLPLGRRDARPRGPARRLPVAHDRPLEPGRAVVHAGLGAHLDAPPADQRPHGYAIRPVTPRGLGQAANRILYVWGDERTIGFTDYTTRVHALDF